MALHVERTTDARFDEAFDLLSAVGKWLEAKGRRQRISATTQETYARWQAAEQNYVVLDDTTIVGIFTVCDEILNDWLDFVPNTPVPFLRALATHPDYRGCGVGSAGIAAAINMVAPRPLYLDCVSDFLPDYYAANGFQEVARQVRTYPDGDYDITLMVSQTADV